MSAPEVSIVAVITDNVGVATAELYVQGQLQQTLGPADAVGDMYTFTWDTNAWANGSYTVEVVALDSAGNQSSNSIAVTLNRNLANLTLKWITRQLPLSDTNWELTGKSVRKFLQTWKVFSVEAEEGANFWWRALVHVPGDSTTLSEYMPVNRWQSFQVLGDAATFRFAWQATPFYVDATYATSSLAGYFPVVQLDADGEEVQLGFFGITEARLYGYDGKTVTTLADIDPDFVGYTARALAYVQSAWWLALDPTGAEPSAVYRFDIDAAEVAVQWKLQPQFTGTVAALAAVGTDLFVGYNNGDGTGAVYRWDGTTAYLVEDTVEAVSAMLGGTALAALGTTNGLVYSCDTDGATLVYDTGTAAPIGVLFNDSGVSFAAVANSLYSDRTGIWALEATFAGETTLTGMTSYRDRLWASFDSANLWRYDEGDGWVLAYAIPSVTAVTGLATFGDALVALTTNGAACVLWRRELAVASGNEPLGRYMGDIGVELLEVLDNG